MPRKPVVIVTVTIESYWMSGELTIKGERKALTFIRSVRKNHKWFLAKLDHFTDHWLTNLPKGHEKLKINFKTIKQ